MEVITSRSQQAYSKTRITRLLLRQASAAGCSLQAQGLLSIILAESFPLNHRTFPWYTRASHARLATRANVSKPTIRRLLHELRELKLLATKPGKLKEVCRHFIPYPNEKKVCSPVSTPSDHRRSDVECSPVSTNSGNTGLFSGAPT